MNKAIRVVGPIRESVGVPGRVEAQVASDRRQPVAAGDTVVIEGRRGHVLVSQPVRDEDRFPGYSIDPSEVVHEVLVDPE